MNILTKSIATTLTALVWVATASAESFPVMQDTYGSATKNTIGKLSGKAASLPVSNKSTAFLNFNFSSAGITGSQVTGARLIIYIPQVTKEGTLNLAPLTSEFQETFTSPTVPSPTIGSTIASIGLTKVMKKSFVVVDVTSVVQSWAAGSSTEFGFAITSDGTAAGTIGAKEGAASGYPAVLEVDVATSVLNGSTVQLQTGGGIFQFGNTGGVADLNIVDGNLPGFLRFRNVLEIWPNSAGTNAGSLDIRNTAGIPTVSISGSSGFGSFAGDLSAGTFLSNNANGNLFLFGGFPPSSGTTLMGAFTGTNAGPQLRFQKSTSNNFIDIGQNGSDTFVVESNDTEVLTAQGNNNGSVGVNTNDPLGTLSVHRRNTDVPSELLFRLSKTTTGGAFSDVIYVRRFGTANPYNFELFEGDAFKPGGGSWGVVSDARLKKNIHDLDSSLEKLLTLRPVTYEYVDPAKSGQAPGIHTGFIAQEVEKVFPEWVSDLPDGYKGVTIKGFESLTVKALGELREEKDAQIAALKAENAALRKQLAENEARDIALEARLARLETTAPASTVNTTAPAPGNGAIETK